MEKKTEVFTGFSLDTAVTKEIGRQKKLYKKIKMVRSKESQDLFHC